MNDIKPDVIIRAIVLIIALVNQLLVSTGRSPLKIEDNTIGETVSAIFTVSASVWAWWKNNSLTKAARAGDAVMNKIKAGEPANKSKHEGEPYHG